MRFSKLKELVEQITGSGELVTLAEVQQALSRGELVVPGVGGGGGSAGPVAHDWVSNGDNHGLFYALGSLTGSWSNPAGPGGPVVADASGLLTPWDPPPTPLYLTDRDSSVNIFHSAAGDNNWVRWDFGGVYSVKIREYTVMNRWDSGASWPSHFKLQGSEDGVTWADIDEVTSPGFTAAGQWQHYVADVSDAGPYRYIRLLDTWDTYLTLGEVELYGDLVTN